jgi:preprotein translocase subunit SecE
MFKKLNNYIKNSIKELKRVSWPTKNQAIKNTFLVVGISLGVAAFLGIIDFFLTQVLQLII